MIATCSFTGKTISLYDAWLISSLTVERAGVDPSEYASRWKSHVHEVSKPVRQNEQKQL